MDVLLHTMNIKVNETTHNVQRHRERKKARNDRQLIGNRHLLQTEGEKNYKRHQPAASKVLNTNLWNMLHLLMHSVFVPLSFEVPVQVQKPELLQGPKGLNALRDYIQL